MDIIKYTNYYKHIISFNILLASPSYLYIILLTVCVGIQYIDTYLYFVLQLPSFLLLLLNAILYHLLLLHYYVYCVVRRCPILS